MCRKVIKLICLPHSKRKNQPKIYTVHIVGKKRLWVTHKYPNVRHRMSEFLSGALKSSCCTLSEQWREHLYRCYTRTDGHSEWKRHPYICLRTRRLWADTYKHQSNRCGARPLPCSRQSIGQVQQRYSPSNCKVAINFNNHSKKISDKHRFESIGESSWEKTTSTVVVISRPTTQSEMGVFQCHV